MKFSTKYNLLFFCLLFSIIIVGQEKIILNQISETLTETQ